MKLHRVGLVLLAVVLISCQIVSGESEDEETTVDVGETEEAATTEEVSVPELAITGIVTVTNSADDELISFEERNVNRFFDVLKNQMKCGYPKFGVPSLVPLKVAYKFKTSLDFLGMKKVHITATNFVIHGLNDFIWKPTNTSFSRSKTNLMLNFPNVTITADTSLNRANGTSRLSLYDATVFLETKYEEKDDLLYVTDLEGDLSLKAAVVKIAHLFPKSARLTKIWNKAIGDSLPVLTKMITTRKLKVDFINRILNGSRYYAMNTANSALATYKMNFDRLVGSLERFSEMTEDSLMCTETKTVEQSRVI